MEGHQEMRIMRITIVCFFVLMVSCTVRKSEPFTQKTFIPEGVEARGETLYMENCQKCHPGGEAGLGPSIISNPAPMFIKRFQMRHGLGKMPAFSEKELTKKDLRDISAYLKAWKKY